MLATNSTTALPARPASPAVPRHPVPMSVRLHDDVFADGSDVCHGCGRYIPESSWDGECARCEPSAEQVQQAAEDRAIDELVADVKSKPLAFANRFLALVERVEKIEASVSGLIGREIL